MSKKHTKGCINLKQVKHLLILLNTITGCVSISFLFRWLVFLQTSQLVQ